MDGSRKAEREGRLITHSAAVGRNIFMLALLESQNNLFISVLYPNASSVLCSGYREGSLTPRRAAKRKNIAQSAKI